MKISLAWLKDYVDVKASVEKLTEALTMAGVEVEHVDKVGEDTVFTVEITPNRADCLNLLGLAREVSAVLKSRRKNPVAKKTPACKTKADISIQDPKDCYRYIGVRIDGVHIADAPLDMIKKLGAIGLRPVNNVVDITNFSLFENGQPLHAFDYDKLKGGKILVRRAKKGEKIVTIDGVERELDPSVLIIADAERPVAIAGIMGGKETEVTGRTKNILLESAHFNPILIRRSSRKLGLASDASYRFERGVVFETVEEGARRALSLILNLAGGVVTQRADVIAAKKNFKTPTIKFSLKKINAFLGADLSSGACRRALKALDFSVGGSGEALEVTPPYFRPDVLQFVDVAEEVARIVGYNQLLGSLPRVCMVNVRSDDNLKKRAAIKKVLRAYGLSETITYAMTSRKALHNSAQGEVAAVGVKNPLSMDQEVMRPTLLPSLLTAVQTNVHRGQKDLRFFETGKIYPAEGERETLGIIMTGKRTDDWREISKARVDFYDTKAAVEAAIRKVSPDEVVFQAAQNKSYEDGQAAAVVVNGTTIGSVGKISSAVLSAWDIKSKDVFFAQVDLENLYAISATGKKYEPIVEFPVVVRDISLAVKKDIAFEQIRKAAIAHGGKCLKQVDLVEEYRGEKVAADQRGLVFSLTYQSPEKTLRDDEVNTAHENVVTALIRDFHAVRR